VAGSMCNYLEPLILGEILKATDYTAPTNVYLSLHTADPTESGAATAEVTGNSYAREIVTFGTITDGVVTNSADVTFDTSSGAWGHISHWVLYDHLTTSGGPLFYGEFTTHKDMASGDICKVLAGQLSITLD
jgi:hypothetical protein